MADLSGLPTGNQATFLADGAKANGLLIWLPTYDDAGLYSVTFRASNSLLGANTTTSIQVIDVDRPPLVTAPPSVSGA
jgi:hypothetical protein